MADEKNQPENADEKDAATPEVDAEVVNIDDDEENSAHKQDDELEEIKEMIEAAGEEDAPENAHDAEDETPEAAVIGDAQKPGAGLSPGLVLVGVFAVAALGIFFLFNFNGAKRADEPTAIALTDENPTDASGATPQDTQDDAQDDAATTTPPAAEAQETRPASETSRRPNQALGDALTGEAVRGDDGDSGSQEEAETTPQTDPNEIEPNDAPIESAAPIDNSAPVETAADLFAVTPEAPEEETGETFADIDVDAETEPEAEPVDPRAAIAALQREAAERAAAQQAEADAQADTLSSVAYAAEATDGADTVGAEDNDTPFADTTTDAQDTQPATANAKQLQEKDFSRFADAVSADTGKIANELESLKEALREETDALSAAVTEGRALSEQQSTRITELRQSLEQAIAERDERANTEISELRTRLDKIQSSSTETPAGRKAAASLALLAVQRAVDEGTPYTDELEVLARLAPNAGNVAGLRASAATGTPTLASLKTQFAPTVRNALAASGDGEAKGILGRIQKLVSVRPARPQPGDRPAAVISRAEANLEQDNLASTVEELTALAGGPAEAFNEWMEKARQRLAATGAIEELNTALLSDYNQ